MNFAKFLRTSTFLDYFRWLFLPKLISMSLTSFKSRMMNAPVVFCCAAFLKIFLSTSFIHKILTKQRSINIAFLLDISAKNIKRKSHSNITVSNITARGLISEVSGQLHINFIPFFERLLTGGLYKIWLFSPCVDSSIHSSCSCPYETAQSLPILMMIKPINRIVRSTSYLNTIALHLKWINTC